MNPYLLHSNSKIHDEWLKPFITIDIPNDITYANLLELIENAYNKKYIAIWKKAYEFLIYKMKINNDYSEIYKIILNSKFNCYKLHKLETKILNKSLQKIKYISSFKNNDIQYIINYILENENNNINPKNIKYILENYTNDQEYIKNLFSKINLNFDIKEIGDILKDTYPQFYNIRFGIIERILLLIQNEKSRWDNNSENYFDIIKTHVLYNKQLKEDDNIIDYNEFIAKRKNEIQEIQKEESKSQESENKVELAHLSNLINEELQLSTRFNFNIYSYVNNYKKIIVHIYSYSDQFVNFDSDSNNWYDINNWVFDMINNDNFNDYAKEKENTLIDFKNDLKTRTKIDDNKIYTLFDSEYKIEI